MVLLRPSSRVRSAGRGPSSDTQEVRVPPADGETFLRARAQEEPIRQLEDRPVRVPVVLRRPPDAPRRGFLVGAVRRRPVVHVHVAADAEVAPPVAGERDGEVAALPLRRPGVLQPRPVPEAPPGLGAVGRPGPGEGPADPRGVGAPGRSSVDAPVPERQIAHGPQKSLALGRETATGPAGVVGLGQTPGVEGPPALLEEDGLRLMFLLYTPPRLPAVLGLLPPPRAGLLPDVQTRLCDGRARAGPRPPTGPFPPPVGGEGGREGSQ